MGFDESTIANLSAAGNWSSEVLDIFLASLHFEQAISISVPVVFALIIFIGCIGNGLVIAVVLKNVQMQNSTNILIFNLAMSDLLFLSFCVPFTAVGYALPVWVFSTSWCKIMNYLQSVTAYSSVWTLVLMAADRFMAVVYPIRSMSMRTCKNATIVVLLVWGVMLCVNIPIIFESGVFNYNFYQQPRSICAYLGEVNRTSPATAVQSHYFSFNAFGYVIPLTMTLILYSFVLHKLWNRMPHFRTQCTENASRQASVEFNTRNGSITECPKSSKGSRGSTTDSTLSGIQVHKISKESSRTKRRVAYMVTAVTLAFSACWLPLNICFFLTGLNYKTGVPAMLTKPFVIFQIFSQVLAYTNSCLNPILYAFLSEAFRRGFYELIVAVGIIRPNTRLYKSFRMDELRGRSTFDRSNVHVVNGAHHSATAPTLSQGAVLSPNKDLAPKRADTIDHAASELLLPSTRGGCHVRSELRRLDKASLESLNSPTTEICTAGTTPASNDPKVISSK